MYRVITNRAQITRLQANFEKKLKSNATETVQPILGHPGGSFKASVYYSEHLGFWFFSTIAVNRHNVENRYWNGFGTKKPIVDKNLNIECEINVPLEGLNRRIAAVFAEAEDGRIVLLHRGKIGGGRKGIGKQRFLENYRGSYIEAIDGDEINDFALVCDINNDLLAFQVAAFVKEVDRIKNRLDEVIIKKKFKFNDEFQGTKKYKKTGSIEATCNHGIIVNKLAEELEARGNKVGSDGYRDLFIHSKASIQSIFEIKPDVKKSSIYSAIGQLFIYSIDTKAKQFIVLPERLDEKIENKLFNHGIEIIVYDWIDNEPVFQDLGKFDS